jgi:3-hydroxyisobutyrate dehydrogenase
MGAPLARHLLDWPGGLVVCDQRPEACDPLVDGGATAVATPREVAERATVVSVMVVDDTQVEDVVTGADGLLAGASPGTTVAVHSTIRPETAERLAGTAAERDVALIDAPVSGSVLGAHQGTLAVLVGGPEEAVARCRPAFERWSAMVEHVGPVGAGTRAKLARNLVHFVSFAAVGEALRLAEAAGIDLGALGRVVRHTDGITGGPGAIILRDTAAPIPEGDGLRPMMAHARALGEKDLVLALDLGRSLGVELPLAEQALGLLGDALGVPHEPDDATEER